MSTEWVTHVKERDGQVEAADNVCVDIRQFVEWKFLDNLTWPCVINQQKRLITH